MKNTNNEIFAKNLKFYMEQKKVDRYQLCADLGFKYSTVSEWLSAKKYPRMDKIEMLAKYFEINKSDLIEDKNFIIDSFSQSMKQHISDTAATLHISENKPRTHFIISGYGGTGKSNVLKALLNCSQPIHYKPRPEILTYQLNELGKQEAIKRVKELTYLPDYKKSDDDKTDTPVPDLLTTKK